MDMLLNPIVIAVVAAVVIAVIILMILRNRRRAEDADLIVPDPGEQVDYTTLPYEEPSTWSDRLRQSSPLTKVLLVLIPLVLIASFVILYLAFFSGDGQVAQPSGPPPTITELTAIATRADRISVRGNTTLPDGAAVTAVMRAGDQDFAWFDPALTTADVRGGRIDVTLNRSRDASAPTPNQDQQYTIVVSGEANGQQVSSEPAVVDVPSPVQAGFYASAVAANTTATAAPATAAPATAAPATATSVPATAAPSPTSGPTVAGTATVFNGGNVRAQPNLQGQVLDQINANETVQLINKTQDGNWYQIINQRKIQGWVSVSLLNRIPADVAAAVPVQGQEAAQATAASTATSATAAPTGLTATVFNGGNVRAQPNIQGQVLDQINANETVQLVAKTSNGQWYRIINQRKIEGWVSVSLLNRIPTSVSQQVPVSQ